MCPALWFSRWNRHCRKGTLSLLLALPLLLVAFNGQPARADDWEISCVDCPRLFADMDEHSLRLDEQGQPHMAYGGDHLYYTWRDVSGWHSEVVDDSPGVGTEASLSLDANGYAHIVYTGPSLKYAYQDAAGWHIETASGVAARDISMALDANHYPHVSYYYGGDLFYTYRDSLGWHLTTVDSAGDTGLGTSLALDASGYPRIGYTDEASSDRLRYTYQDAQGWHTETVTTNCESRRTSLALDANGYPHLAFQKYGSLQYAYKDASGWHTQSVGDGGNQSSIALDAQGYPHVATYDGYTLLYYYRDASVWYVRVIGYMGDAGSPFHDVSPSLALDGNGAPYVSYCNIDSRNLELATWSGTSWQVESVDHRTRVGSDTSLALDAIGYSHISYYDSDYRDLKYAYQDADGWHVTTVDPGWQAGRYSSLAVDAAGYAHISYDDGWHGVVKYARQDAAGWVTETVGSGSGLNDPRSLALDQNGYPHISYESGSSLRYAHRDSAGWHVEYVGTQGNYGSLALDNSGYPHISYYNQGLRYSFRDAAGWHHESVDSGENVGLYTSLQLDASGRPHISYYSQSAGLKYAARDAAGWFVEVIDSTSMIETYTSLAFDKSGHPHISYWDGDDQDLMHAVRLPDGWHLETIDTVGNVGRYSSLAVDGDDALHISYYDASNLDLKLARSQPCIPVEELEVTGPERLGTRAIGSYTATYSPTMATLPLALAWDNGTLGATVPYSWTLPGTYTLTVTATNSCGQASAAFAVEVRLQPVESAAIDGPASLVVGQPGWYSASYEPLTATLPVTLTWSDGTVGPTAAYSWTLPGTYTLTVTATNSCGQASDQFTVTVVCQPVEAAIISGPASLLVSEPGSYSASYEPPTATLPVTLTWSNGIVGPTAAYSWTLPGTYTLTVTATNSCGQASDQFTVTVVCQPVEAAIISGPASLLVGEPGSYSASYEPLTATLPVTLTWSNGTVGPTAAYSWTLPGTYTLTVTATNSCGQASASLVIQVSEPNLWVYLPLVVHQRVSDYRLGAYQQLRR